MAVEEKRLAHALVNGMSDFIGADVEEGGQAAKRPPIVTRPADGRLNVVGDCSLRTDVPAQGVKSAGTEASCFAYLMNLQEEGEGPPAGDYG